MARDRRRLTADIPVLEAGPREEQDELIAGRDLGTNEKVSGTLEAEELVACLKSRGNIGTMDVSR